MCKVNVIYGFYWVNVLLLAYCHLLHTHVSTCKNIGGPGPECRGTALMHGQSLSWWWVWEGLPLPAKGVSMEFLGNFNAIS